jgi:hypothetical protein
MKIKNKKKKIKKLLKKKKKEILSKLYLGTQALIATMSPGLSPECMCCSEL